MKNRTSKDNTIVRKKVQTRRFNADIRYGLNSDQVNEYFENGWSNEPVEPPSKTVPEIINLPSANRSRLIHFANPG